jgi:hypothetical protein
VTTEPPDLKDFPSLDAWGDELRDATERKEARSARFRLPIRRIAVAVAVMLLAVPGAIATRSIWVDPIDRVDPARDPNSTPAVLLAEGDVGNIHWRLGAFDRRDDTRCVQLQTTSPTFSQSFGGCTRPLGGPAQLTAGASTKGGVGFMYGAVTAAAAQVKVTVAGGRTAVAETIEPDAESLRRAGLTKRRVWIATFPGGVDFTAGTPLVVVLDDDGREIARVPEPERTP